MKKMKSKRDFWIKCGTPIISVLLLWLFMLYIVRYTTLNIYSFKRELKIRDANHGFLINTVGCRIPSFDPFDKKILKYIYKPKPFTCSNVLPLVKSDLNYVYIDEQQLPYYNVTNQDTLSCCYQPFWRNYSYFGNCTSFKSSAKINEEYVKIICNGNKTEIHKDFHAFVPIKKYAKKENKLKVLVVGLDSMSRSNFYRQMPLTKDYLLKLNAIEMIGYNKVGDNTFENLIPTLTGLTVNELQQKCWPTPHSTFDDCDFIWKNYSKAGYLTAFAEDEEGLALFNLGKGGFTKQPTDYYFRTFNLLAERGTNSNNFCIGPRPRYTVLLDYAQKVALSLRNENYFGLFWGTSLTHGDINYAQLGDKYHKLFFQGLRENNILNDTILITLSDHGPRSGAIRTTHQGQLEDRLPYLFFIFPPWFLQKYASAIANLRRNSKRLTTPFDLHETLLDLINTEQLTADNIKQRSTDLYTKRGISLFFPVPENRTCSSAHIDSHWCTCHNMDVEIDKNSYIVAKAAAYIVSYMNELLKDYKGCAVLELDTIIGARLSASNDYLQNHKPIKDYRIQLKTKPGGALFEGTVRCVHCKPYEPFSLTGTITRLNLYGNQSACIDHYHLKLYCYCS